MENNNLFSIKLIGFNTAEIGKFSAILTLADFGLHYPWEIIDTSTADFYLLKDVLNDQYIGEKLQNRCFYYAPLDHPEKENVIVYDKNHVPMLHDLITLLNASAEKNIHRKSNPADASLHQQPSYSPSPLLKYLTDADAPLLVHLTYESDDDTLYINPEQHVFYYPHSVERLSTRLFSDAGASVEHISMDKLKEAVMHSKLSAQPIKHLVWHVTFTYSDGRLMRGLSEHDMLHLTEWPYLGTDSRNYIKLATYLKKHTASLTQAIKATGIDPAIAYDFYNACHLAGLVELRPSMPPNAHENHTEKLGFLDKIKQRLRH